MSSPSLDLVVVVRTVARLRGRSRLLTGGENTSSSTLPEKAVRSFVRGYCDRVAIISSLLILNDDTAKGKGFPEKYR